MKNILKITALAFTPLFISCGNENQSTAKTNQEKNTITPKKEVAAAPTPKQEETIVVAGKNPATDIKPEVPENKANVYAKTAQKAANVDEDEVFFADDEDDTENFTIKSDITEADVLAQNNERKAAKATISEQELVKINLDKKNQELIKKNNELKKIIASNKRD